MIGIEQITDWLLTFVLLILKVFKLVPIQIHLIGARLTARFDVTVVKGPDPKVSKLNPSNGHCVEL